MNDIDYSSLLNPAYGDGIYRRKIRVQAFATHSDVELEDDNHAFKLWMHHDRQRITDIQVESIRYPLSTCPSANDKIIAFIGRSISELKNLGQIADAKQHCTHLFDLLQLAIDHTPPASADSPAGDEAHCYDITIPDEKNGEQQVTVSYDGQLIHQWSIANDHIVAPAALVGKPLMKGFYQWIYQDLSNEHWRAAEMLQRGLIVARGRRFEMEKFFGERVDTRLIQVGVCHSLQPGVVESAVRKAGTIKDFSDNEAALLKFID